MKRSLAVGLYVAGLLFGTVGGAFADDGPPGDGAEQAPGGRRFQGGFPGGGPGAGGFRRQHGARPPKMEQVMSLKSLSKDQQSQIQAIYSTAKEEMKPLMQQMRDSRERMKSGGGGQSGAGGADGGPAAGGSDGGGHRGLGEAMGEMRPLMQQLKAKREATWTKVKAVLTDAQIKELEQMRGGNRRPGGARGPGGQGGPGPRSQPQVDDQWTKGPPDNSDDQ